MRGRNVHTRPPRWIKSSFSGVQDNGECVEVADLGAILVVRDSKDPDGHWLTFDPPAFEAATRLVQAGRFDCPVRRVPVPSTDNTKSGVRKRIALYMEPWTRMHDDPSAMGVMEVAFPVVHGDTYVGLRNNSAPDGVLLFTTAEWSCWLSGVRNREFDRRCLKTSPR
ncbi:DUF397 domain-containing protein [Crossiella sp. CA198]|uniref:DUF397 domain-containing protein n=1 Tax=Crossiella sp. CA198 TaxID=3455607 RepID=UPI003F8D639A